MLVKDLIQQLSDVSPDASVHLEVASSMFPTNYGHALKVKVEAGWAGEVVVITNRNQGG